MFRIFKVQKLVIIILVNIGFTSDEAYKLMKRYRGTLGAVSKFSKPLKDDKFAALLTCRILLQQYSEDVDGKYFFKLMEIEKMIDFIISKEVNWYVYGNVINEVYYFLFKEDKQTSQGIIDYYHPDVIKARLPEEY